MEIWSSTNWDTRILSTKRTLTLLTSSAIIVKEEQNIGTSLEWKELKVEITQPHSHAPNLALKGTLSQRQHLKTRALSSRDPPRRILREVNSELNQDVLSELPSEKASKQFINRLKASNEKYCQNATTRKEIVVPRAFKSTLSKKKFYYDDSDDHDRIMLFVTGENLELMTRNQDWLCDGTFDITPLLFKQLFTIHIVYKDKPLPCSTRFCLIKRWLPTLNYSLWYWIMFRHLFHWTVTLKRLSTVQQARYSKAVLYMVAFSTCFRIGGEGLALYK